MSEEGYKNIIKSYKAEVDELYEEIAKLNDVLEEIKEYLDIDKFVSFMPHTKRYTHLMKIRCDLLKIINKEKE